MIRAYIDLSAAPAFERDALQGIEAEILTLLKGRLNAAGLRSSIGVSSTAEVVIEPGRPMKTIVSCGVNGLSPMTE